MAVFLFPSQDGKSSILSSNLILGSRAMFGEDENSRVTGLFLHCPFPGLLLPLLSSLSKPFVPPTAQQPLRWRYTTYMGESHPTANKVVVEFSVNDIDIHGPAKRALKILAGPRWDPRTNMIKMSCESFQTQAQNKRYLGETIAKLIKEAKEGKDKFLLVVSRI